MKILAIIGVDIRRMLRERSNIFFVFIFPVALILLIGAQFGGGVDPAIGVTVGDEGDLSDAILDELGRTENIDVRVFEDEAELRAGVERGHVQAGVFLPAAMDELAADGEMVSIGYVGRSGGLSTQLQSVVGSAVAEVFEPVGAAQYAAAETGYSYEEALAVSRQLARGGFGVDVAVSSLGDAVFPESLGQFDLGASQQLVLFVFLTAFAGGSALILTRQLGISQRMLSTPTPTRTVIVGEAGGRFGVAILQGLYIMVITLLLFSVDWGDPLGAFLILIAFSAVGAGAGMLMGAVFSNEQQASGVGVVVSLGLAALGGCMVPIELFSPTMQRVAHVTPHAWALDGFAALVRRGGTTSDILTELGVLALFALTLLLVAAWRLQVVITHR